LRDAAGRVVSLKDYDANGRLDEDATIAWGAANKPVHIKTLGGEDAFSYDAAARLAEHAQLIDGKRWTVGYRYDEHGRRSVTTLPGGQQLAYRYRGSQHPRAGLLESVWLGGPLGLLDRPVVQGMNGQGDTFAQRRLSYGNGLTHEVRLDGRGRVVQAGNDQVGQTRVDYPAQEQADPSRVTVLQQHGSAAAQVPQTWASQAFGSYALAARWQSEPLTLASAHDTQATRADFVQTLLHSTHDALGRQTVHAGPQGLQRLIYDSQGRLIEVRSHSAAADAPPIARYRYNLFGQRIAKTVASSDGAHTRTTYFLYDGSQLVAEAEDQGAGDKAITQHYVWVNQQPVAWLRPSGLLTQVHAIHSDHRNAPMAVTDEARRVLWQARVEDFGRSHVAAQKDITFNLRLSNQYFDAETGLHYNTHRYFDPATARYTSADPLGLAAGPDLHAFALNRPHEFSDPLGLQPVRNDWSDASFTDKLGEVLRLALEHSRGTLSQDIRNAIQAAVDDLPTTVALFAAWHVAADRILTSKQD
jgi:RHS repeat-associated protein